jgi:uncharacterized damage-inducible protein DinB
LNEIEVIINQLKCTFDGDSWHDGSFLNLLEDISSEEASNRPLPIRHTVWEIVDHCTYWMNFAAKAIREGRALEVVKDDNWPEMGKAESEWHDAISRLRDANSELLHTLDDFKPSHLDEKLDGTSYTYRVMLHGVSDHNVYHMGQIAILRPRKTQ